MPVESIITALLANGPLGIVCAVLLYRDFRRDERELEREKMRISLEERRLEADKTLAVSMSVLAERIQR